MFTNSNFSVTSMPKAFVGAALLLCICTASVASQSAAWQPVGSITLPGLDADVVVQVSGDELAVDVMTRNANVPLEQLGVWILLGNGRSATATSVYPDAPAGVEVERGFGARAHRIFSFKNAEPPLAIAVRLREEFRIFSASGLDLRKGSVLPQR
jgi:hypothetical protein